MLKRLSTFWDLNEYTASEDPGQTAHLRCLIRAIAPTCSTYKLGVDEDSGNKTKQTNKQ